MAHTASCERARSHRCQCAGCGGSLHGWPGLISLAQPSHTGQRAEFRQEADREYVQAIRPKKGRIRLTKAREAATDAGEADLTSWLAAEALEPGIETLTRDIIATLGDLIAKNVLPETDATVTDTRALHLAMADHFWCDLLAQFACAMNRLNEEFDKVPEHLTAAIQASRRSDKRSVIEEVTVTVAVKCAIDAIRKLPAVRSFDDTVRAVKTLAVFMCPAPERHRAVCVCCLDSLGREAISAEVAARLRQVLPRGWLTT